MSAQALLLAVMSNVCFMGLVASLYRPVWFRANGRVPSRWKIGGIWLALCSLCVVLSLNAGFRSPSEADPVPHTEVMNVETFSDIAMPIDVPIANDGVMDAAQRTVDEAMDAVAAVEAEPVTLPAEPPRAAAKLTPAAKPAARASTPQR